MQLRKLEFHFITKYKPIFIFPTVLKYSHVINIVLLRIAANTSRRNTIDINQIKKSPSIEMVLSQLNENYPILTFPYSFRYHLPLPLVSC